MSSLVRAASDAVMLEPRAAEKVGQGGSGERDKSQVVLSGWS